MLILATAILVALGSTLVLSFARFTHTDAWRATVTPLASIIGSGFLIAGPLLAKDFGGAAILAMAALLLLAYAVGAVVRFNIVHVENFAATAPFHDGILWLGRVTQVVLSLAYAVSVAYYLKLLAEFALKPIAVPDSYHALAANGLVTAIVVLLTALALGGDLRRVEHLAHGTVSLKIGIIAGLLAALALWWAMHPDAAEPLPPVRLSLGSVPMLLGLLITVQGFETSRYLGHAYPQELRIRTMRHAQWIAAAIYLGFIALLTPLLGRAAQTEGVAGILDVMGLVASGLGVLVLIAALASQLSAAVADSIGSGGLMSEVSRRRLSVPTAFALANTLAVAVVWLTDPLEVVAVSSRAFAVFYALQCALALAVSRRTGAASPMRQASFVAIGLVCLVAALVGAPAE
jgi:hypothetical protein